MHLKDRDLILSLLDEYSNWLLDNGYLDSDYYTEKPLDEFMRLLEYNPKFHLIRFKLGIPEK